jgi:C1A family cysteine protease
MDLPWQFGLFLKKVPLMRREMMRSEFIIIILSSFILLSACSFNPGSRSGSLSGSKAITFHALGAKFDKVTAEMLSGFSITRFRAPQLPFPESYTLPGGMPPIGDQSNQGSCVAWSTTYYMKTYLEGIRNNGWDLTSSNHQFSPAWTYNQIDSGEDNGAYPSSAMTLITYKGADTLADFPYNQSDYYTLPTTFQCSNAIQYTESGWEYAPLDTNSIRALLASGMPVVIAIEVYTPDFDYLGSVYSLTGDVYCATNSYVNYDIDGTYYTSYYRGGHAICLVGYDDNKSYTNTSGKVGYGAFKLVNSWGTVWDDSGYGWISYAFLGNVIQEAVIFY